MLRSRSLPMRLILPGLRTEAPELCSWGERPVKAASALGVNSAMFGSSASSIVAEVSPKPVMLRSKARLRAA